MNEQLLDRAQEIEVLVHVQSHDHVMLEADGRRHILRVAHGHGLHAGKRKNGQP